ncbi:unnamed protein product, partial [Brassica oleracea]
ELLQLCNDQNDKGHWKGWQPRDGPSKLRDAPNPLTKKSNQLNRLENLDHVEREKLWPLANK